MAVNLVELVSSAITPDTLQGISRVLGERDSAVQSGVAALVPALLGGLANKASTPTGASNLLAMLNSSNVDSGALGNVAGMLGSGQSDALLQQGSNLLGGLLGSDKATGLATALAGMTGMKAGNATNLLTMIVPLILGVLKRFIGDKRLGPNELAETLAGQKKFLEGKLDPRLTSAMGFASPTSLLTSLDETAAGAAREAAATMGRAGATARATAAAASTAASAATTSGNRRSWLPWALAAIVAAALLTMLPRFGADKGAPSLAKAPDTGGTPAAYGSAAPAAAPATTETAPSGATTAMGAAPASLPAKIYFETGKAELGPEASAVVKSVSGMLAANPSAKVDLTGYTDKTGDSAMNQELAKKRANAVKAALESAGVAPDRVGMKEPMAVESGAAGSDAEARRVDIAASK